MIISLLKDQHRDVSKVNWNRCITFLLKQCNMKLYNKPEDLGDNSQLISYRWLSSSDSPVAILLRGHIGSLSMVTFSQITCFWNSFDYTFWAGSPRLLFCLLSNTESYDCFLCCCNRLLSVNPYLSQLSIASPLVWPCCLCGSLGIVIISKCSRTTFTLWLMCVACWLSKWLRSSIFWDGVICILVLTTTTIFTARC